MGEGRALEPAQLRAVGPLGSDGHGDARWKVMEGVLFHITLFNFFTTQRKSIATFCAVNIIRSLQFLTCFFSFLILFKTISF